MSSITGVNSYSFQDVDKLNNRPRSISLNANYEGSNTIDDPYAGAGVIYEPSGRRAIPAQNPVQPAIEDFYDDKGVRLELSKEALPAVETSKASTIDESWTETIKRIFYSAVDSIKGLFEAILADDEKVEATKAADTEPDYSSMSLVGLPTAEERLAQLLKEDGRGSLAKNSDLLTYYDRSGRVITPNATDKNKILHGNARGIAL